MVPFCGVEKMKTQICFCGAENQIPVKACRICGRTPNQARIDTQSYRERCEVVDTKNKKLRLERESKMYNPCHISGIQTEGYPEGSYMTFQNLHRNSN